MPIGSADTSPIAQLARDFAFSSMPQLNPATEFDIRVMLVGGLWEALQMNDGPATPLGNSDGPGGGR